MWARTGLILMSLAFAYVPTAAQAGHGPGPYRYTSIPTLPGGTFGVPNAINRSGHVVGQADSGGGGDALGYIAFLFDPRRGVITSLGPGNARAVNDRGWAVGRMATREIGRLVFQSVLYRDGMVVPLGSLQGEVRAAATSINNHGVAVGYSLSPTSGDSLALYDRGSAVAVDLGPDLGFTPGPSPAISDDGFISGTGLTASGDYRAFRYHTRIGVWAGPDAPGEVDSESEPPQNIKKSRAHSCSCRFSSLSSRQFEHFRRNDWDPSQLSGECFGEFGAG
jgi:hypothetical protein